MAKLYFHYSTMNAGKSTLLLQAAHNYRERGMAPYLLTARLDDRAGAGRIASRIGIAAIGYGDGYPRHAPTGTPVLVRGQRCPTVGRVSMDLLAIDLTELAEVEVGDPVRLWGQGLPVEVVARHAGTIGYELTCGVTRRVLYVEDELI